MRAWLKFLRRALLAVLLLPPLALWLALATDNGFGWLLAQVQGHWPADAQAQWKVRRASGNPIDGLDLFGVEFEQQDTRLQVERLEWRWRPGEIFSRRLAVTALRLWGVRLQLPAAPPQEVQSAPLALPVLPPWVADLEALVEDIQFDALEVRIGDQPPHSLQTLGLGLSLKDGRVRLERLQLRAPEGTAQGGGELGLYAPHPLRLELDWRWSPQGGLAPAGHTRIEGALAGPAAGLRVRHHSPADAIPALACDLELAADLQGAVIRELRLSSPLGSLQAEGKLRWDTGLRGELRLEAQDIPAARWHPALPPALALRAELAADYGAEGLHLERLALTLPAYGTEITGSGSAKLESDPMQSSIQAAFQWRGLAWPLGVPSAMVVSEAGSVTLSGAPRGYRLELAAQLGGEGLPAGHWRAKGDGGLEGIRLESLRGELLGGVLELSGDAAWAPQPAWVLQIKGMGLNPGVQWPDWPGRFSFSAHSRGRIAEAPEGELQIEQSEGELRGQPLTLAADLQLRAAQLEVTRLRLGSGRNLLSAEGRADEQALDLGWKIDAPDLAVLLPAAAGRFQAEGRLSGSPQAPRLEASLKGADLRFLEQRLAKLEGAVRLGPGLEGPLAVDLGLDGLARGGQTLLERFSLHGEGRLGGHRIELALHAPEGRLGLSLQGGLDAAFRRWSGRLAQLALAPRDAPAWQQTGEAELAASAAGVALDRLCLELARQPTRLCGDLSWQAGGEGVGAAAGTLRLDRLPLALLSPDLSGELNGGLQGGLAANGALSAAGHFELTPGEMRLPAAGGQVQPLVHRGGELRLAIDQQGLNGRLSLLPLEDGSLEAELALPGLNRLPLPQGLNLQAQLRGEIPDLGLVQLLVPELKEPYGRLSLDLVARGPLERPRIGGQLLLADAGARVPAAGLELKALALRLEPDPERPERLRLRGGVASGPGALTLEGDVDLTSGRAELKVFGEDFEALKLPEASAQISPRLTLGWDGAILTARGELVIPQLAITPRLPIPNPFAASAPPPAEAADSRHLPVVAASADVVVRGRESAISAPAAAPALPLDAEVRIQLGSAVRIDGAGLQSRLTGELVVRHSPQQREPLPRAKGAIRLREGSFRSFGQDLEIEWGQVLFDNVPLDQPELDIRAVRWIDDDRVKAAGIQISGLATAPHMELFSRPQVDDQEVQSYLLTGRAPDASGEQTLTLGTEVAKGIFVGYGIDPLEGGQSFILRYDLLRWLGLALQVGEADKSLHLSFSHER